MGRAGKSTTKPNIILISCFLRRSRYMYNWHNYVFSCLCFPCFLCASTSTQTHSHTHAKKKLCTRRLLKLHLLFCKCLGEREWIVMWIHALVSEAPYETNHKLILWGKGIMSRRCRRLFSRNLGGSSIFFFSLSLLTFSSL